MWLLFEVLKIVWEKKYWKAWQFGQWWFFSFCQPESEHTWKMYTVLLINHCLSCHGKQTLFSFLEWKMNFKNLRGRFMWTFPFDSRLCLLGSKRFSPAGLQHRMVAELSYLSAIEESVRQLSDVERVRGISLAQQESVSLAQIIKVFVELSSLAFCVFSLFFAI